MIGDVYWNFLINPFKKYLHLHLLAKIYFNIWIHKAWLSYDIIFCLKIIGHNLWGMLWPEYITSIEITWCIVSAIWLREKNNTFNSFSWLQHMDSKTFCEHGGNQSINSTPALPPEACDSCCTLSQTYISAAYYLMAALLFFYPPPTANIVWQVLVQTPPLRKCSATFKVTLCDWQTAATANRPSVPAGLIKPEVPSPTDTQRSQQHGGKMEWRYCQT